MKKEESKLSKAVQRLKADDEPEEVPASQNKAGVNPETGKDVAVNETVATEDEEPRVGFSAGEVAAGEGKEEAEEKGSRPQGTPGVGMTPGLNPPGTPIIPDAGPNAGPNVKGPTATPFDPVPPDTPRPEHLNAESGEFSEPQPGADTSKPRYYDASTGKELTQAEFEAQANATDPRDENYTPHPRGGVTAVDNMTVRMQPQGPVGRTEGFVPQGIDRTDPNRGAKPAAPENDDEIVTIQVDHYIKTSRRKIRLFEASHNPNPNAIDGEHIYRYRVIAEHGKPGDKVK